MTRHKLNKILTISGGLTCLTGLFLLVHYESRFSIVMHQVAGLIFMIFSISHIKFNFKGIKNALGSNSSKCIMAFLFIGCVVIAAIRGSFTN